MITIIGIDPGPEESAYARLDDGAPIGFAKWNNADLASWLVGIPRTWTVAYEWIQCYGMRVGAEVFETCFWTGRFAQAVERGWEGGEEVKRLKRVTRSKIRACVCRDMLANDANVRAALIERFGPTRAEAIGTKKKPGPLHGIRKDMWSALAVAVTYYDTAMTGKVK